MAGDEIPHPNAPAFRQTRLSASERLNQHLESAISEFSPKKVSATPMRGMQRLSFLTQNVMAEMDRKADAVAERLSNAQKRSAAVIDQFGAMADSIERSADEAEAALGQFSNDPTQVASGS